MDTPIQSFAADVRAYTLRLEIDSRTKAGGPSDLLERDAELTEIGRLLTAACSGTGALVIVEGVAGAGKTRLVEAAVQAGLARGMMVLPASGSELERELGFGVVRSLVGDLLRRASAASRQSLLSGAAALAAPVVWPQKADIDAQADPAAVLHGLFWLVSNLTEHQPLMLVVDDAHWTDAPSLRFLAYLARRLGGLPLLLLVAMRPNEPGGHDELVWALRDDPSAEVLRLAALSEAAVGRLVADRFDGAVAAEFVVACHEATGGNPFLVGELLSALLRDGVTATAAGAERVGLIGPRVVSRAVLTRVARVGGGAGALTEAVAVLGGRGDLRHAAALAGLEQEAAARAADALSEIEVLHPGRPLRFVHPLVHAAVYEAIAAGRRSVMHRAAAGLLARDGASPDRVALHLLNAEPANDQWVVAALRQAAAAARAQGAPEMAARYLRRGVAEPPSPEDRASVLQDLGTVELLARDPSATDHLVQALDAARSRDQRGAIALLLGRAAVSTGRLADAREVLGAAVEELQDERPELAARLESYRSAAGAWHPLFAAELERELPRLRLLAERGGTGGRSLSLLIAFRLAFEGGDREEILDLIERGLDHGRFLESESAESIELTWATRALTFIDELDRAERLVEEMVADSRRRGSVNGYATASTWRAAVALRRGRVFAAESDARSALELTTAHGLHFLAPYAHSFLGEALIEQGELEEAATLFEQAQLGPMHGTRPELRFLHSRARARLGRGDAAGAIADLRACERSPGGPGFRNPNVLAWRSTLALALGSTSRDEAFALVDAELDLARKIGQPRAIGVALRARGLLCKGEEQIALLAQAVTALEVCPSKLEQAYTLTELGAAFRRASRRGPAQDLLRRALDLAADCRANALAARARAELVTAGARPRRMRVTGVESLTASERRVAEMAASEMTNREIAQRLFVTVKAVAQHLTHVYDKLEIAGRSQLAEALSGAASETPL